MDRSLKIKTFNAQYFFFFFRPYTFNYLENEIKDFKLAFLLDFSRFKLILVSYRQF